MHRLLLPFCVIALLLVDSAVAQTTALGESAPSEVLQSDSSLSAALRVDPRVELLSIIFRLAGNPEYNQGKIKSYIEDIEAHFGSFRQHPAIVYARQLREEDGISFDAVMSMAIHIDGVSALEERFPFDDPEIELDRRWTVEDARTFLEHARQFAGETEFEGFFGAHQPLYELAEARMRSLIEEHVDLAWFEHFFGERPAADFTIVLGLVNGGANYGPRFRAPDRSEELFAIMGAWLMDEEGMPVFDERVLGTIIHEFSHSFVNPTVGQNREALSEAGEAIYARMQAAMQRQAYGHWETMVAESLVRAAVIRYLAGRRGAEAAAKEIRRQETLGFLWIEDLVALLEEYEGSRDRYPAFSTFYPRVVLFFEGLSADLEDVLAKYEAKRPRVIAMTPPNGSEDVDPSLRVITFTFDRPMQRRSYSVMTQGEEGQNYYPEVDSVGFDASGKEFKMAVQLKPNWRYEFSLNSESGGAFKSEEGVPLRAYPVRFRTRSERE